MQLGFVKHDGCSKAILALKTVQIYFYNNESPAFICSLVASKAFDRNDIYKFPTFLINRSIPESIINLF